MKTLTTLFTLFTLFTLNLFAQWQPDVRLTNDPAISITSQNNAWCIAASGNVVHVVWTDDRNGSNDIFYKRSTDGGMTWGTDTPLNTQATNSYFPSVSVSGQVVHVVWHDFRDGNAEIYYKRSTDGGVSWGADTRLTNNASNSYFPSVSVSGSVVHVVWEDFRDGNYEIYYKRSTDGGVSWGADTRLTNNTAVSIYPSVTVSGSVVHVVWHDFRDGNYEIYYKRSTDGGIIWGTDTRLTNNSAFSADPSVTVSGSIVHVVWYDSRDGNYEIYYKRDPTGNPVGIININSEVPNQFSLSQNYPNPFNPNTVIRCSLPVAGMVTLKIYDVLGNEVETLVNEQLNAGTYEVDWDASGFSSGVYFYKIDVRQGESSTDGFSDVRKMMLVK